jgi:3-oxoacyl-[acyl-carrier-protein] synthase-1
MSRQFGPRTRASSTKAWTGHTLGAAGIVEAVVSLEAMRHAMVPGTLNLEVQDPALSFPVLARNESAELRYVMSNSFGFGGSNVSLVFGRPNA